MFANWLQKVDRSLGGHVVNVTNVTLFMLVQTVFFVMVAAKQVDSVTQQKGTVAVEARKLLLEDGGSLTRDVASFLDIKMHRTLNSNKEQAKADKANAWQANQKLLIRDIGWPLGILIGILVILLIRGFYNKRGGKSFKILQAHDKIGLLLVILAFATEGLFFLLVVRRTQFIGDIEIMRTGTDTALANVLHQIQTKLQHLELALDVHSNSTMSQMQGKIQKLELALEKNANSTLSTTGLSIPLAW